MDNEIMQCLGFKTICKARQLDDAGPREVLSFRRLSSGVVRGNVVYVEPRQALLFEVSSAVREPWVGSFECGPGGLTGVFATPSPDVICIVVRGQGYWIPVQSPEGYQIIRSIPIREVLASPSRGIMVFVDDTRLAGHGDAGPLWVTERLSWDGLRVTEVTPNRIKGTGWDSPASKDVPFCVDIDTGATQGGSSPEKYRAHK